MLDFRNSKSGLDQAPHSGGEVRTRFAVRGSGGGRFSALFDLRQYAGLWTKQKSKGEGRKKGDSKPRWRLRNGPGKHAQRRGGIVTGESKKGVGGQPGGTMDLASGGARQRKKHH